MLPTAFLWYQFKHIKNHKTLYIFMMLGCISTVFIKTNLIQSLLYIFLILLNLELFFNFKNFFNIDKQILFTLPFDTKKIIKSCATSSFIKILIFLTVCFFIKLNNISDLLVFLSTTVLCYAITLFMYLIRSNMTSLWFIITLNSCFGFLFLLFNYINKNNIFIKTGTILFIGLIFILISEFLLKRSSSEKIIDKE